MEKITGRQLTYRLSRQLNFFHTSAEPGIDTCSPEYLLLDHITAFIKRLPSSEPVLHSSRPLLRLERKRIIEPLLDALCMTYESGAMLYRSLHEGQLLAESLRLKYNKDIICSPFFPYSRKEIREYNALVVFQAAWNAFISAEMERCDQGENRGIHTDTNCMGSLAAIKSMLSQGQFGQSHASDLIKLPFDRLFRPIGVRDLGRQ